jgi:pyrimidine-nucleoside phosphorylase
LGLDAIELGAGRRAITDKIDPKAGLVLHKHLGDKVQKGDPLITLHTDRKPAADTLSNEIKDRFRISEDDFTMKGDLYEIL